MRFSTSSRIRRLRLPVGPRPRRAGRPGRRRAAFGPAAAIVAGMALLAACGSTSSSSTPTTSAVPARATISTTPASPATTAASTTTVATTTTSTTVPPSGSRPGQCLTAKLNASVSAPNGTAGAFDYSLSFFNAGATACTLSGYPGVSFVAGANGHQVGAAARRLVAPVVEVTLGPGERAWARVSVADTGVFPRACKVTAVLGFRVYPPGDTRSMFVPHADRTCAASAYVTLGVGPVQAS